MFGHISGRITAHCWTELKIKLPKNSKLKRISHLKPTLVKWTIGQMIALVKITENKFSENLVYGEQILKYHFCLLLDI